MPDRVLAVDANRLTLSVPCVSRRYQDYQASDIPVVADQGVSVRVMAGEYFGTTGPYRPAQPGHAAGRHPQPWGHLHAGGAPLSLPCCVHDTTHSACWTGSTGRR